MAWLFPTNNIFIHFVPFVYFILGGTNLTLTGYGFCARSSDDGGNTGDSSVTVNVGDNDCTVNSCTYSEIKCTIAQIEVS